MAVVLVLQAGEVVEGWRGSSRAFRLCSSPYTTILRSLHTRPSSPASIIETPIHLPETPGLAHPIHPTQPCIAVYLFVRLEQLLRLGYHGYLQMLAVLREDVE